MNSLMVIMFVLVLFLVMAISKVLERLRLNHTETLCELERLQQDIRKIKFTKCQDGK